MTHSGETPQNIPDRKKIHGIFEAYLLKLGLRQTKQRRIILDATMMLGPHVDAEAIGVQARKIDASIGVATVYRTLQLMVDSAILVEHQFGKDRAQFEFANGDDNHHDHLICNQCGAIVEFFDNEVEQLQEQVAQRLGFKLMRHRMELFADCLSPALCERPSKKKKWRAIS